jgi:multidrug efflux system membrane fusion protein
MDQTSPPELNENKNTVMREPEVRHRAKHRWWIWLIVIAIIGIAAYFYFGSARKQHAQQENTAQSGSGGRHGGKGMMGPMPVVTAAARTGDISVYLNGLGSVTALNTATVKSRVDGQLMKIFFKEGQIVKQGDVLAEIDPRPYQVQLTQAEGQMARDQALLKNAQLDLERYQTLYKQDSIAKQQLDTQASLVRQYAGAVKVDQGQIDNAKLQLTYSRVTAPIPGRLGLRQVDVGNIVHATDTNGIVVITQVQPVSVIFTIPEDNIPSVMQKLRKGETMEVDAYDRTQLNKLAAGTLTTIDNQIDPTTGTVRLKAQFSNEGYTLFPNQFVNTRLLLDIKHGITMIPAAGIQRGNQGAFVYVVKNDKTVTVRPVKVGVSEKDDVEIVSGLAPGEVVVVDGADKLREGAKVQVATANWNAMPQIGQKHTGSNAQGTQEKSGQRGQGRQHKQQGGSDGAANSAQSGA